MTPVAALSIAELTRIVTAACDTESANAAVSQLGDTPRSQSLPQSKFTLVTPK